MSKPAQEFDPFAVAATGHNGGPPLDDPANDNVPPHVAIFQEIDDLYEEAKNFADGEAISSQPLADAITALHDNLHALGKKADDIRKEEKKPLDDKIDAIQSRFNPYIQPKKGKVDLAKSALSTLLASWRTKLAEEKAAEAAAIAKAAEEARAAANAAMQASSGNLAAREEAEELLADAKKLERTAKRADKAATTGTGLRTIWKVDIADEEKALEWAYTLAPGEFMALALSLAEEKVRGGARELPGFLVREEKVASVGRAA